MACRPSGSDDEKSEVAQTSLGELLMLAGKFDAARAIWAKLAVHDSSYTGARILLAIAAARQGDSAAALQTMRVVDSLAKAPYAFGRPFVQEARIAAALGRNDDAGSVSTTRPGWWGAVPPRMALRPRVPGAARFCAVQGADRTKGLTEARAGIEPANSGFADRCLTTWLPRRRDGLNRAVRAFKSKHSRRRTGD